MIDLGNWEGALEALRAVFEPLNAFFNEIAPQLEMLERLDHRHLMRRKVKRLVRLCRSSSSPKS